MHHQRTGFAPATNLSQESLISVSSNQQCNQDGEHSHEQNTIRKQDRKYRNLSAMSVMVGPVVALCSRHHNRGSKSERANCTLKL